MAQSRSEPEGPSLRELVALFLNEASTALEPWVVAQGGACTIKLTHANARGHLEVTTPDALHGVFLAEVEFRTPLLIGEMSYGDRDLTISAVVSPFGRPLRHGLWEWADAVGEPTIPPRDTQFVSQPDRLRDIVRGMSRALVRLGDVIAIAQDGIVERMTTARARAQAEQTALWRQAEHEGAVRLAHEAFRTGNWARVVELLTSVHDLLSPAEVAKLRYAEARMK
ncbi:MAG: hypothetical protein JNL26_18125 [Gemmatimonadetes bacterium]|nr:hypothetical protein [Gemmatimonadota bacterium]